MDPLAVEWCLDTCQAAPVEAETVEVQSQCLVEGSLQRVSGLVVHWGVLGKTGAHYSEIRAEVGPYRLVK